MVKSNKKVHDKKLVSRREFLVGSGAVIAAIALTACTPKTTTETATKTATATATTTATTTATIPLSPASTHQITPATSTTTMATQTLTPKSGGTLRAISGPIPANVGWPPEMVGYGNGGVSGIFETLLWGDEKGNVMPWLAESYKVADDKKSITFNLKKGVKFHDGSDFNAEAAKWSLDNYIQSKMQPNWASVDKIDDYTIRVNFTQWKNTLPASFGDNDPPAYMMSKVAFDKNGIEWMRANPVGTGPFKFVSYKQDDSLKVEKNPDYWIKGQPYLDGMESLIVVDPTTTRMLVQSGEADLVQQVMSPKDLANYASMGLKVDHYVFITWALVPDTSNADSPWANLKVRQAADYAIDREGIAKAFGFGYWQPLYQIPPSFTVAYDPNFPLARKYDLDKAKQLLAEAGYPNGFDTTIIANPMGDKNICVAIQDSLAKAGIRANSDFPEMGKWATYMGPNATWKNAALYTIFPAIDRYYTGGLQWMFVQLGQSWQRTPEMTKGLDTAISSPVQDVSLVRAVTDMMTENAALIPINEGMNSAAMQTYVNGYASGVVLFPWQSMWFNK